MNKAFFMGKLKVKLIGALIFSLALAAGLSIILQTMGESLLDSYLNKSSFIENQQKEVITDFRHFVMTSNIKSTDQDKITKWVHDAKYINLFIFDNNKLSFATDGTKAVIENKEELLDKILSDEPYYDVQFSDKTAEVYMMYFFEYKYYYIVGFINMLICLLCFIILMLFFINRKTSYISLLENEIKILEGGDIHYPITIKGSDELSSLAGSINEMRRSFIERIESEDSATTANRDLITAMSHDLRTPLTALVGYLDIIIHEKYKTQHDLNKYLHNSRDKAYQIKHLSDKLFEYFTVFKTDEDDLEFELFDGIQVIEQFIDEQLLVLQSNGFNFQVDLCDTTPFNIEIHLSSFRRVFDNIFSNILKYADKAKPISITSSIEDHNVVIEIENHININLKNVNSTGIGLKTCEKIIENQFGHFTIYKTKETFTVQISIAIRR